MALGELTLNAEEASVQTPSFLWWSRVIIACLGVLLFRHGRQRGSVERQIGAVLLIVAPWFFQDISALLGFCGGIAATLWVFDRIHR